VNAHEGFSFICEFVEYSQKGFLRSQVTERFADHTYPSLLFQVQLLMYGKSTKPTAIAITPAKSTAEQRNAANYYLLLMWSVSWYTIPPRSR
jgi:hypothetical protein